MSTWRIVRTGRVLRSSPTASAAGAAPAAVLEPQAGHEAQRFVDDAPRELGFPRLAVAEDDRELDDAPAGRARADGSSRSGSRSPRCAPSRTRWPPTPPRGRRDSRMSRRSRPSRARRRRIGSPIATANAADGASSRSRHPARTCSRSRGRRRVRRWPPGPGGPGGRGRDRRRSARRSQPRRRSPGGTRPDRRTRARAWRSRHELDGAELAAEAPGEDVRAVRAAVVDHHDADVRDGHPDPLDDRLEVLDFVVGRDHGDDAHGPRRYAAATRRAAIGSAAVDPTPPIRSDDRLSALPSPAARIGGLRRDLPGRAGRSADRAQPRGVAVRRRLRPAPRARPVRRRGDRGRRDERGRGARATRARRVARAPGPDRMTIADEGGEELVDELMAVACQVAVEGGDVAAAGRTGRRWTSPPSRAPPTSSPSSTTRPRRRSSPGSPACGPATRSSAKRATHQDGASGVSWLIDPIDGTTNFVYGVPQWATSVAASSGRCGPGRSGLRTGDG